MDLNEIFFLPFVVSLRVRFTLQGHLKSSNNVSATLGDMGREF